MVAAIVMGSLLALNPLARAQDPPARKPAANQDAAGRRGNAMQRLTERLKLTDEQKPKVEAALKEMRTKAAELRKDTSLTPEERRTKMQPLREALNKQMKGILTPDQYEQWQKMSARNPRGGRKARRGSAAQN